MPAIAASATAKPCRLHAAGVVLVDRDLSDLLAGIAEQLLAGRSQLSEVVAEGARQLAQRARGDATSSRFELGDREVVLLAVFLELGAHDLDAAAETAADGVEQLLAAHAPRVTQHQVGVVGGVREVVEGLGDEGVGALLDARDANEARLGEQ